MSESRIPEGKQRVAVTLEDDIVVRLDELARVDGVNRSRLVRTLVIEGLRARGWVFNPGRRCTDAIGI